MDEQETDVHWPPTYQLLPPAVSYSHGGTVGKNQGAQYLN